MSVAPFNFDEPEPRRQMHRIVGGIVFTIAYASVIAVLRAIVH